MKKLIVLLLLIYAVSLNTQFAKAKVAVVPKLKTYTSIKENNTDFKNKTLQIFKSVKVIQ